MGMYFAKLGFDPVLKAVTCNRGYIEIKKATLELFIFYRGIAH